MAFDEKTWKERIKERLKGWKDRMDKAGGESVYGFIAGAALWPVIKAASGGDLIAPFVELGKVLGGVGTNLLANLIQKWKDQGTDEIAIANQIASEASREPDLRKELDAVLEKMDAFALAGNNIQEGYQPWFFSALQKELKNLGNLGKFQASITGTGNIAQADRGGVAIGGNNYGDIYSGLPPKDYRGSLKIYRGVFAGKFQKLPLLGLDSKTGDPTQNSEKPDLEKVYVDLDTTFRVSEKAGTRNQKEKTLEFSVEGKPLSLQEAVANEDNRKVVVLGDPGSGKSTFLSHLGLCLALHGLDPEAGWMDRLPNWPENVKDLIPFAVVLRDFARECPIDNENPEPINLWSFIKKRLNNQNLDFAAKPLEEALEKGNAIGLLDGLDEIPSDSQRAFVLKAITAFTERYRQCRIIVTCRKLTYQDPAWRLDGFSSFEIAPFDKNKIEFFIQAWYAELERLGEVTREKGEFLSAALAKAVEKKDLARLAPNPLLLTVMAVVNTHKGKLPDARAVLYEDAVDILLMRWDQNKADGNMVAPLILELLQEAGRTDSDLKKRLSQLAFEIHKETDPESRDAMADIGESLLLKFLRQLHPSESLDWAVKMASAIKFRAGLLVERKREVYTFPHRTFQEYLAGIYLSNEMKYQEVAYDLLDKNRNLWREAVLLSVGSLVHRGDTSKPLALVAELCPEKSLVSDQEWQNSRMAGEILNEMGVIRVKDNRQGQDLLERVKLRLEKFLPNGRLRSLERAEAGRVLSKLGDPRDEVTKPEEIKFIAIPKGPFLMGSKKNDKEANEDESPQESYGIPYEYKISRFPITNAQYEVFVKDGGYNKMEKNYWKEAEAAGVWKMEGKNGVVKGRFEDFWRDRPYDFGEPFNLANHPVVGVTWYEALAFCRWLTDWLHGKNLYMDFKIRLPSEPEWEKAARGTEGGVYPWGPEPDPEKANYGATKIETTSAVGCFPNGKSPYSDDSFCHVEEMSGNVWEWTRSVYGEYPYPADGKNKEDRENLAAGINEWRVLRGGAFSYDNWIMRCAARGRYDPDGRNRDLGFRVVASPFTSEL